MMKKINLQNVVLFFISLLLFTSCIGTNSNSESGYIVGVVRIETKTFKPVLDVSDDVAFYSVRFENTNPGACLHVYYELDFDSPENSYEVVASRGYFTVNILDKVELDQWYMSHYPDTTSQVLTDEVALLDPAMGGEVAYVKGMAFFGSILEIPAGQTMYWRLSCDMQDYMKEEGGSRYYDVFLRATVKTSSNKSPERTGSINAYDMQSYLERIARDEKNRDSKEFKIRFNYVSEIKDEVITWKQQESLPIFVAFILGE